MGELVVNVAELVHRPGLRRHHLLETHLETLRVGVVELGGVSPVVVDVMLEAIAEGIMASGTVDAAWRAECRRCLGAVQGAAHVEFRELYEERPTEGESYLLADVHLDLEPMAREALVLDLPLAPLCGEDCQGLCSQCGADLNLGPCGCRRDERDPRWAALDALRFPAEP